jgi:hypothetical protein
MRLSALALACILSACASTYAANPNDPVDMAAELGDRGRQYIGMGEICDASAGGAHRQAIVTSLQTEQVKLGVLSGLVNRAYRGHATDELAHHMRTQMHAQGVTMADYCAAVVTQAQVEVRERAAYILSLTTRPDLDYFARQAQQPNT